MNNFALKLRGGHVVDDRRKMLSLKKKWAEGKKAVPVAGRGGVFYEQRGNGRSGRPGEKGIFIRPFLIGWGEPEEKKEVWRQKSRPGRWEISRDSGNRFLKNAVFFRFA